MVHLLTIVLFGLIAPAADTTSWPGLWGPSRNASVADAPAAPTGADVLWRHANEGGYSEIAVHDGFAVTMEQRAGDDFVVALDAATGRERWRVRVGAGYKGHDGSDNGPIATPAISGADVFALGPFGQLMAIDLKTGKERWRHDLAKAYGATAPLYGFAPSPLVEGRHVIVPTSGASSKGLLAFDRATGTLAWSTSVATKPSYSSAIAATLGGVRQVIAVSGDAVYAVSPADGKVLWRAASTNGDEEVANPPIVLPGDRVLISDWAQSVLIGVTRRNGAFTTSEIWRSPRLRANNGPTVYRDGHLYGFVGPQLICMDANTGDVKWRERTGPGTLIALGNNLLVLAGDLHIVRAVPERYELVHKMPVFASGRTITGPSYAGGRLYVRNQKEVVALRLK
ncbi:MAG: PQQ-binding-like beta-propeller repeat protein [Acidobacteriota bacterium]|nr:PQQ-binding-like beta-propeller repeat protein [Acidobacteriota bacterium]